MNKRKILLLAKCLSEVHSHTFSPGYRKRPSRFWLDLESKTSDPEEVDKIFFIKMAEGILKILDLESQSNESNPGTTPVAPASLKDVQKRKMDRTELLAEFLAEIHSFNLSPFYESSNASVWEELDEKNNNSKEVDRSFFKKIAKKILSIMENLS